MGQSIAAPGDTGYGAWSWQQIEAAILGGTGISSDSASAAASYVSDPQTLQQAAQALYKARQAYAVVRQTLDAHSKALAGPGGQWKGAAAQSFSTGADYYGKVVQAHIDQLDDAPTNAQPAHLQVMAAGYELSVAQKQIKDIDAWYGVQALKAGASQDKATGLVNVNEVPQAEDLMNRDMRKVITNLADNYSVTYSALRPPPANANFALPPNTADPQSAANQFGLQQPSVTPLIPPSVAPAGADFLSQLNQTRAASGLPPVSPADLAAAGNPAIQQWTGQVNHARSAQGLPPIAAPPSPGALSTAGGSVAPFNPKTSLASVGTLQQPSAMMNAVKAPPVVPWNGATSGLGAPGAMPMVPMGGIPARASSSAPPRSAVTPFPSVPQPVVPAFAVPKAGSIGSSVASYPGLSGKLGSGAAGGLPEGELAPFAGKGIGAAGVGKLPDIGKLPGGSGISGSGVGGGASALAGGGSTAAEEAAGAALAGRAGGTAGGVASGALQSEAAAMRGAQTTGGAPPMYPPPMGGAGGGQGGQERERATWLLEQEDVWGADPDVPDRIIGR